MNSTFAVRPTELDGVNVWMLEYIASSTGIAFTYDLVFLPPALSGAARPTQLAYLFGTLGYDCLISATEVKAESLAVARFLLPNEQAGLSVVIPIGSLRDYTVLSVLFSWTNPCAPHARTCARLLRAQHLRTAPAPLLTRAAAHAPQVLLGGAAATACCIMPP